MTPRAPASPAWQSFGSHRFYIHNDVLFWEARGATLIADISKLFEQRELLQREYGYSLVVVDTRQHGGVPPEARRYVAMHRPEPPLRGNVTVFGASLLVRTALSLILGAARRFGRLPSTELLMAADEAEAWTLVTRSRQQFVSTL